MKVGYSMQVMAMDLLGPLPESSAGNSYVIVIADYFTRWVEAFALPNHRAVASSFEVVRPEGVV